MRAVVSFANTPFYQEKMKRLQESVEAQGIKFIGYKSFEEVGCKPHSEVPYQFKPYAIQKAMSEGVTTILWCDSPLIAIGDLKPVFDYIENYGMMFFNNYGHSLGMWTNDFTLNAWKIERTDAMNIKMIMACCMGFDVDYVPARAILERYQQSAEKYFPGSWDNHRHDQSLMSILIHKNDYQIIDGHKTFFIYEHFKQVPEFQPIAKSICLVSR